uniref:C2H2-type domain-containing protein n=1 Tax=viral metagenome TaxID=1070528 RepID=A0A6H1Z7U6_9ZZZZ
MAVRGLTPITTDQQFYALILDELHEIRLLLTTVARAVTDAEGSQVTCPVCARTFQHDRALRAHMRSHDKHEGGKP